MNKTTSKTTRNIHYSGAINMVIDNIELSHNSPIQIVDRLYFPTKKIKFLIFLKSFFSTVTFFLKNCYTLSYTLMAILKLVLLLIVTGKIQRVYNILRIVTVIVTARSFWNDKPLGGLMLLYKLTTTPFIPVSMGVFLKSHTKIPIMKLETILHSPIGSDIHSMCRCLGGFSAKS